MKAIKLSVTRPFGLRFEDWLRLKLYHKIQSTVQDQQSYVCVVWLCRDRSDIYLFLSEGIPSDISNIYILSYGSNRLLSLV